MFLRQSSSVIGDLHLLLNFVIDKDSFLYGFFFALVESQEVWILAFGPRWGKVTLVAPAPHYYIFFRILIIKGPIEDNSFPLFTITLLLQSTFCTHYNSVLIPPCNPLSSFIPSSSIIISSMVSRTQLLKIQHFFQHFLDGTLEAIRILFTPMVDPRPSFSNR